MELMTETCGGTWGASSTLLDCPSLMTNTTTTLNTPDFLDSNITLESMEELSGLFDTGFTDGSIAPLQLKSSVKDETELNDFDDLVTLEAHTLLQSLGSTSSYGDNDNVDMELDASAGSGLPAPNDALDLTGQQDNYLEVFTDLTDFLTTEKADETVKALMEMNEAGVNIFDNFDMGVTTGMKRTSAVAFVETEQPINHDHDDYTTKRQCLSTSSDWSEASYDLTSQLSPSSSCASLDSTSQSTSSHSSTNTNSNDKYRERRQKNNVASRRSRQSRKQKFVDMEQQAIDLEKSNSELEEKVKELDILTKLMKDILVKKMSGAK